MTVDATRQELVDALKGAGIATVEVPDSRWAPPCAIVGTDDPWLVPVVIAPGWRRIRYAVDLVAGRADNARSLADLADLAQRASQALDSLAHWSAPTVGAARSDERAGGTYLVARLTTETQAPIT